MGLVAADFNSVREWFMQITKIHHVQLAMPRGREAEALQFMLGVLGIPENRKPRNLGKRGACWFVRGAQSACKAHPAFLVKDVPALRALLKAAGCSCKTDESLEGYDRI